LVVTDQITRQVNQQTCRHQRSKFRRVFFGFMSSILAVSMLVTPFGFLYSIVPDHLYRIPNDKSDVNDGLGGIRRITTSTSRKRDQVWTRFPFPMATATTSTRAISGSRN
jgi:hypothetical protein